MLTVLAILGVLAALFLAAALATRDGEALAPAPRDAADLALPVGAPVRADDVRGLRFGLAARGYRMSEVDAALERLAGEIDERDRRLAELGGGAAPQLPAGDPVMGSDRAVPAEPVTATQPGTAADVGAGPVVLTKTEAPPVPAEPVAAVAEPVAAEAVVVERVEGAAPVSRAEPLVPPAAGSSRLAPSGDDGFPEVQPAADLPDAPSRP